MGRFVAGVIVGLVWAALADDIVDGLVRDIKRTTDRVARLERSFRDFYVGDFANHGHEDVKLAQIDELIAADTAEGEAAYLAGLDKVDWASHAD